MQVKEKKNDKTMAKAKEVKGAVARSGDIQSKPVRTTSLTRLRKERRSKPVRISRGLFAQDTGAETFSDELWRDQTSLRRHPQTAVELAIIKKDDEVKQSITWFFSGVGLTALLIIIGKALG